MGKVASEAILNQREIIIIVVASVVVFLGMWRVAGYFARLYIDSILSDIRKLFDLHEKLKDEISKIKDDCKDHEGRISSMDERRKK